MATPAVHISGIKSFLRCRLSWFWSAPPPRGLGLEPNISRASLHLGRTVHEALQVGYDTGRPFAEAYQERAHAALADLKESTLFAGELDKIQEQITLGVAMMKGYQTWAAHQDEDVQFLALETKWSGVRMGRIPLEGRFDAIVQRADGLWVLDFKTTASSATGWTTQDLQATAYVHAARALYGKEVRGILFRFLLKKIPLTYDDLILKDGSVTRRKALHKQTTYREYLLALAVATLKDLTERDTEFAERLFAEQPTFAPIPTQPGWPLLENYATILEDPTHFEAEWYPTFKEAHVNVRRLYHDQTQLLKGRDFFFREVEEYRTEEQIRRCIKYVLYPAAKAMTSRRKRRWVGPTGLGAAFAVCSNCAFKSPCALVMRGADYRDVLKTEYRLREEYRAVP